MRVVALDYGSARCGVAVSDPSGTLATPRDPVLRPQTKNGFKALKAAIRELEAERVVVGLPLSLSGRDSAQTIEVREFAERLARAIDVPVELYDERFTTSLALQAGGKASLDSRAAATLLDEWLRLPIREENPPQA
ncbi:Holliday junction resolvase RuvX [Solirubrobacter ginsenosidimutans]|uniref:Putative pre-16S rRNA nuclease n=1 Tax=Solirubrobacter ginsenosidimutans TaxID=490573 RepID=A0A9X3N2R6_9ACTN|nr:Holliday junction resolvase RuvX [Solirubrobacter ginsenosidimutans]MDA0165978.1 Holliday junction resolvase RuvX [Solirubrobacter ginsenosidimutans]